MRLAAAEGGAGSIAGGVAVVSISVMLQPPLCELPGEYNAADLDGES
jgi:hypothetical protein